MEKLFFSTSKIQNILPHKSIPWYQCSHKHRKEVVFRSAYNFKTKTSGIMETMQWKFDLSHHIDRALTVSKAPPEGWSVFWAHKYFYCSRFLITIFYNNSFVIRVQQAAPAAGRCVAVLSSYITIWDCGCLYQGFCLDSRIITPEVTSLTSCDSVIPLPARRSSSFTAPIVLSSHCLIFSSLDAITAPPSNPSLSVVSAEGRVEMQRLYYLKQFTWREGQTVGRFITQPNTTAGEKHPTNQRKWARWSDMAFGWI